MGRAGHGPGRIRRALVLTGNAAELLEASVTAASGLAAQCEPLQIAQTPLDVLCQQILGLACAGPQSAQQVFDLVRRAEPYRALSRTDFDDCLNYLFGVDQHGYPWLPARLEGTKECFSIRDNGLRRLLCRNLGTILDDPHCEVRQCSVTAEGESCATTVGTLTQAFADRLNCGDRFLLDGRCLEVLRSQPGEVLVREMPGRARVPHWGGDGWPLSPELARRLFHLRVQAAEALRDGPEVLAGLLKREYGLDDEAAALLVAYFERQECVSEAPDSTTALIEFVAMDRMIACYWHTPLNRRANDALARVAVRRLVRDWSRSVESCVADLGFVLFVHGQLPQSASRESSGAFLRVLLDAKDFHPDLEVALKDCDSFRQRFAQVAQTGLMLLRQPLGGQRRVGGGDWPARRLFEQVYAHNPDFVLLRQARRELLSDVCDAATASAYVEELPHMPIRCRWLPYPSPFAESWTQWDQGAHEFAESPNEALRRLHASLLDEGDSHAYS
jgi:ATP-dependent Lhr-like helicase